jgi:hypothetical protein
MNKSYMKRSTLMFFYIASDLLLLVWFADDTVDNAYVVYRMYEVMYLCLAVSIQNLIPVKNACVYASTCYVFPVLLSVLRCGETVEFRPLTGPLSILQMTHELIWSIDGTILTRVNRSAASSTTNPTWTALSVYPGSAVKRRRRTDHLQHITCYC